MPETSRFGRKLLQLHLGTRSEKLSNPYKLDGNSRPMIYSSIAMQVPLVWVNLLDLGSLHAFRHEFEQNMTTAISFSLLEKLLVGLCEQWLTHDHSITIDRKSKCHDIM